MYLIVLAVAIFLITVSLSSVISPDTLRNSLLGLSKRNWLWPVSVIRILLGTAFLMASGESSIPMAIDIVGIIMISAGILLPFLGKQMLNTVLERFLEQKDWLLRICAFVSLLFGIFLALSGLPQ